MWAQVEGEVETEEGVLVIRRIHVTYHLQAEPGSAEVVARVHGMHAGKCPVYRSLAGCIDITTEVVREEVPGGN